MINLSLTFNDRVSGEVIILQSSVYIKYNCEKFLKPTIMTTNGPEPHIQEFLLNTSPKYLKEQYKKYKNESLNLHESWKDLFMGIELEIEQRPQAILTELKIKQLIDDFRLYGHRYACTNILEHIHSSNNYLDRLNQIPLNQHFMATQFSGLENLNTNQLKRYLQQIFIGHVGVEFGHVSDPEVRRWIENKLRPHSLKPILKNEQINLFKILLSATHFEEFLQKNYQGKKRFSLEGGEGLICALHTLAAEAVSVQVKEISLAMAHRGRLNVLANFISWPLIKLFSEFEEFFGENENGARGDVKYHLGHSNDIMIGKKKIHISLAFNPSHLEHVYPVVLGATRAKVKKRYNGDQHNILPVIIHGDASVIGQGIVAETLNFSELPAYSVGGAIHFIINNQLGFTANSKETRSTLYCTDFAKAIEAPIFHINGEDVESIVNVTRLAFEFRQKFSRDIFVDINCYRKYGHNETDEPRYTNPLIYKKIDLQISIVDKYQQSLLEKNIIDPHFSKNYVESYLGTLEDALKDLKTSNFTPTSNPIGGDWSAFIPPHFNKQLDQTESSISKKMFLMVLDKIHYIPENFKILPKLKRSLENRYKQVKSIGLIDWPLSELIAFGSLLQEGKSIRLVGQDSIRGTFSQRHAAYADQISGELYFPLKELEQNSSFEIYNSPLTENAALAFEFGYSLSDPKDLTLWEAQYGDFCNGAQVIIDQFIAASESKWNIFSGIVLLLPHGYEGQGPDHSSARIERFLQLSAQGNIQVVVPSTAAQYFHVLRRQILRSFRKPLIIFTPKKLLRSQLMASPKDHFLEGGFKNILSSISSHKQMRSIICCGKLYWELFEEVGKRNLIDKILFIRIEQLYPLDIYQLKKIVDENQHINEWFWAQEEPQNCGAWGYIKLKTLSLAWKLKFLGRPIQASTAEGCTYWHIKNQNKIIEDALKGL